MKTKQNVPLKRGCAKVPVMIQMEALECGASCLTMILAYYGKWLAPEQVRSDCAVSRDGVNAGNMVRAARSYGLTAKGYRTEVEALKDGPFPCIIHWNFNHFVVLDGFTKKGNPVLNDPARGRTEITLKDLEDAYTGIQICLEPGENFEPSGAPKSVLQFARRRLHGTGPAFAFVALTSLITALIGVISPGFSRVFIDRLLSNQNPEWAVPFLIATFAMAMLQFAISCSEIFSNLRINGKFDVVGNAQFVWKLFHLPIGFFTQRSTADLLQRQSANASVASTMVNLLSPLLLKLGMAIFYLVVMLRYSLVLSLIGMLSLVVDMAFSNYLSKRRMDVSRVQMRDAAKLSSAGMQCIEMIETIKSSGAEEGYFRCWSGYQASVNSVSVRHERKEMTMNLLPSFLSMVCDTAILIIGVLFIMEGKFTYGMVMAFQGYLGSFTGPVQSLISARQQIQEMRTQMERIDDVMEYPDDPIFSAKSVDADNFDKLSGNVEIKNLTFGYNRLKEPLISNLNLTLTPGKKIALVGGSGCGKSTVAKLVSGLYQPWSGEILFDGKPISQIDRSVFTGSVAVVDQDITLFADTIANNIKMWDDSIEDFEMIMAARDAQIHTDIMRRDGGYQHRLLENGADLSGGQRQRLEIARVLAQDPTIIILDEATSALDAKTEFNVVNAIAQRGITCIVVAHRLSTIRDCDEILVMDHGHVMERGTHEELYAKGGLYTRLVSNE